MAKPTGRPMRDEIVASATTLIQQVGIHGFSYGDLALQLGIKAPSIHHHFKAKEDLIAAVATAYRVTFAERIAEISDGTAIERISAYSEIFIAAAHREQLCLCGAVSADWLSVGEQTRHELHAFYEEQCRWLQTQLQIGVTAGEIRTDLTPAELAAAIYATLQGSTLMTRASGDSSTSSTAARVVATLVKAQ
jgi:TetR/AcrR family transcriptional repressor of nem operon